MIMFKFNNENKDSITKKLIDLYYSKEEKDNCLIDLINTIDLSDLENLITLSQYFLEIAETTYDFELAYGRVREKNLGTQNLFKLLFREQINYLENSDICEKCEVRFLLEHLSQTNKLTFYCNNCLDN